MFVINDFDYSREGFNFWVDEHGHAIYCLMTDRSFDSFKPYPFILQKEGATNG